MINDMIRMELADPALLAGALKEFQDPALKARFLEDTLRTSIGGTDTGLRTALSLYQDPAERLAKVEHAIGRYMNFSEQSRASLCTQLSILGHSEADLQRVRSATCLETGK